MGGGTGGGGSGAPPPPCRGRLPVTPWAALPEPGRGFLPCVCGRGGGREGAGSSLLLSFTPQLWVLAVVEGLLDGSSGGGGSGSDSDNYKSDGKVRDEVVTRLLNYSFSEEGCSLRGSPPPSPALLLLPPSPRLSSPIFLTLGVPPTVLCRQEWGGGGGAYAMGASAACFSPPPIPSGWVRLAALDGGMTQHPLGDLRSCVTSIDRNSDLSLTRAQTGTPKPCPGGGLERGSGSPLRSLKFQ